jgi:asparagine synthase (glutamine-hydrolysing)
LRQFDPEGVADFLTYGCTLNWKTLFRGIEILPGGSAWSFEAGQCRKGKYFSTETWESQPQLAAGEFENRFQETFKRILPRYFESPSKIGVALTGGLDTRMIMACRPQTNGHTTCYTFSGNNGQTLDDRIAGRVAATTGLEHQLLRLGPDFFSNFAAHADKAVFVTDGCAGIFNAHEPYFNRQARQLAPIRLTGNYGSEILRNMSTFKPIPFSPELLSVDWRAKMDSRAQKLQTRFAQPMTFAAFKEIPWNLYGNLSAGRSQLSFRTPYLDNELVSLAFQAPEQIRKSSMPSIRLILANDAALGKIPTDRGFVGKNSGLSFLCRRVFAETTFKLDYYNSEGLPSLLAPFEPVFKTITSGLGVVGLHKFLRYRSWFRNEFADYARGVLNNLQSRSNDFWNPDFVKRMASKHIEGRKNYSLEINAVLTLEAVERLLFRELPAHFN